MRNINEILPWLSAGVGAWACVNGLLHDIFVLAQKRKYDRDLLRLLMDGHILLTCGIMQVISWKGLLQQAMWSFYVSGIASLSLLVYCGMIFPFLKSFATIVLNVTLLVLLMISFLHA